MRKKTLQMKNFHNHYLDKGSDIMKNTQFKVFFGVIITKDSFSPEQITKLEIF